ncbi:hypothetical protein [Cardinium endosymbiont of Dermatophagoides farinae]|nr:hypothetical protein [Cardinium endosymbiont of Dermatophagoides farinae]
MKGYPIDDIGTLIGLSMKQIEHLQQSGYIIEKLSIFDFALRLYP